MWPYTVDLHSMNFVNLNKVVKTEVKEKDEFMDRDEAKKLLRLTTSRNPSNSNIYPGSTASIG